MQPEENMKKKILIIRDYTKKLLESLQENFIMNILIVVIGMNYQKNLFLSSLNYVTVRKTKVFLFPLLAVVPSSYMIILRSSKLMNQINNYGL